VVTLPNGSLFNGLAFKTTPLDVAKSISQGLADAVIVAKVLYSSRLEEVEIVDCDDEAEKLEPAHAENEELWDLTRPLIGNCSLKLLKYEDSECQTVLIFTGDRMKSHHV
jgi:threonyl-tRNA synthetase